MLARIKKRMVKWGLSAAKMSLAAAMLTLPALPAQADDEDSHDHGARVEHRLRNSSMHWFGIQGSLGPSAPASECAGWTRRIAARRCTESWSVPWTMRR
jgi:hypothetical protein